MTEPPRPSGDGTGGTPAPDPTVPQPPPPGGYAPPPPGGYAPPPPPPPPPGGYTPPPPGGYQPGGYQPGGYPPGPGFAPPGYASSDDKTWALIAHFGGAAAMFVTGGVLGFVAPLIAFLAKGQQSPSVRAHAAAALNFQILWSIIGFVSWILTCALIGFLGVAAAVILGVVFGIVAGVKANEGELYRYPLSLSIIK